MEQCTSDRTGPLGDHVNQSSESVWQSAVLRQQQQTSHEHASPSLPPSIIPAPPSRTYSRRQSDGRLSQVSPLMPEQYNLSPDKPTFTDASSPYQAPTASSQSGQPQWPDGRQTSPFGRDQPPPEIPRWAPPHPAFSPPNQTAIRSIPYAAAKSPDGQPRVIEKPSR